MNYTLFRLDFEALSVFVKSLGLEYDPRGPFIGPTYHQLNIRWQDWGGEDYVSVSYPDGSGKEVGSQEDLHSICELFSAALGCLEKEPAFQAKKQEILLSRAKPQLLMTNKLEQRNGGENHVNNTTFITRNTVSLKKKSDVPRATCCGMCSSGMFEFCEDEPVKNEVSVDIKVSPSHSTDISNKFQVYEEVSESFTNTTAYLGETSDRFMYMEID